jgi:hypothetical protein
VIRRVLFAVLFIGSSGLVAASEAPGVHARLSVSCATCKRDEPIELLAGIENPSRDAVRVYGDLGWGELGGFVLHIEDANGKSVEAASYDDDMIVPSTLDDPSYYASLREGHSLWVRRVAVGNEWFPARGTYTIWVSYRSPVPMALAADRTHFVAREAGYAESRKVKILVVD